MRPPNAAAAALLAAVLAAVLAVPSAAQPVARATPEPVDAEAVARIRHHGLEQSEVMDHLAWLTDVYGPRLTGSAGLDSASAWVVRRLDAWGLDAPRLDPWGPFGLGWTLDRFSMHVTEPVAFPVHAFPKAWSPGVHGAAEVVLFDPETADDFAAFDGRLEGRIVMMDPPRALEEPFEPYARRRTAEELLALADYAGADERTFTSDPERVRAVQFRQLRDHYVRDARPLALIDHSYRGDYGTLFVSGASVPIPVGAYAGERPRAWDPQGADVVPQITLADEHYNRLYRLLERGRTVRAEIALDVTFDDADPMEYNVLADLRGADPAVGDEVVMLGAHLDSWHAGTGATDNGAGSAVMMEVMRILQATYADLGRRPRRTIRLALWTGEEQGLLGSRAYVNRHLAESEGWGRPAAVLHPAHERFSAYYNMDNGTGRIRGIYAQGNDAAASVFRAWLKPFHDLDASTVSLSNTGGTDHLAFDAVGLPGFQFIQDHAAYGTRTHHSNMDVYDHALADDLRQAATIIASFVYHTAERDDLLPRKPLLSTD